MYWFVRAIFLNVRFTSTNSENRMTRREKGEMRRRLSPSSRMDKGLRMKKRKRNLRMTRSYRCQFAPAAPTIAK